MLFTSSLFNSISNRYYKVFVLLICIHGLTSVVFKMQSMYKNFLVDKRV